MVWNVIIPAAASIIGAAITSRSAKKVAQSAEKADPFAPLRPFYQEQLKALEANPALAMQRPGFVAGQTALERLMASRGYSGSGNMASAIFNYGSDFFSEEMARLASLAGAQINPGSSAVQAAQAAAGLNQNALGQLGYGLGMLGNWLDQTKPANSSYTPPTWVAPDYSLGGAGGNYSLGG